MSRVIAVAGKGGTGKTMLSALMIRILGSEQGAKILAIDADSSVSLSYALGMDKIETLSDVRAKLIEDPFMRKQVMERHIRDVIGNILKHSNGFDLLVMGRPEGAGCYCGINDLLRYGIESLSKEYDFVIVDGEAGPEQINRRVLRRIDTLIILSDTSHRSLLTAEVIHKVAEQVHTEIVIDQKGLIINRLKGNDNPLKDNAEKLNLEIFGYIPDDEEITEYDLVGRPISDLPNGSHIYVEVKKILHNIGILQ
jgi:CO dehydrogenase maturation factor